MIWRQDQKPSTATLVDARRTDVGDRALPSVVDGVAVVIDATAFGVELT